VLEEWRGALMEQWAGSVYQKDTAQATAEANAAALAQMKILEDILELDADKINTTLGVEEGDVEMDQANRAKTQAATGDSDDR
jgi:hypothetical protein